TLANPAQCQAENKRGSMIYHSGGRRLAHHSTTPPADHQPMYSTAGILNRIWCMADGAESEDEHCPDDAYGYVPVDY
ncbi:hypothetical protein HDV02_000932, partial [Globomyces sp. JEL0801]